MSEVALAFLDHRNFKLGKAKVSRQIRVAMLFVCMSTLISDAAYKYIYTYINMITYTYICVYINM
jgi:hypothetical protein